MCSDTGQSGESMVASVSRSIIASTSREGARLVPVRPARTPVDIGDPRQEGANQHGFDAFEE